MTLDVPEFDDVLAAQRRLAGHAVRTPLLSHPVLDARVGARTDDGAGLADTQPGERRLEVHEPVFFY